MKNAAVKVELEAPAASSARAVEPEGEGPRTLGDLAALGAGALEALYRAGTTPRVKDLDGDLVGRMLAIPKLPRLLGRPLRRFAGWRRFPWCGKSFQAMGDGARGEGINRVF